MGSGVVGSDKQSPSLGSLKEGNLTTEFSRGFRRATTSFSFLKICSNEVAQEVLSSFQFPPLCLIFTTQRKRREEQ